MGELLLLRHGESQGNVAAARASRAGSHVIEVPARDADVELTELGVRQAEATGEKLARWVAAEYGDVDHLVAADLEPTQHGGERA